MVIKYIALNEDGATITGTLEVASPERAQEALWEANLIVLRLKKQRTLPSLSEAMPTLFGIKPLDIITFTRELASLLESGIALVPSLRILYDMTDKTAFKKAIRSLIREVETGSSFSQACINQPNVFPAFYTRLLQVAEETGEMKKILLEIVTYMEKQSAMTGKIKKALTYPTIVAIVGLVAAIVLITTALPAMTGLLTEYGAELPFATRILVAISDIGEMFGTYIIIAIAALALAGWQYFHTVKGRRKWDDIILRMPFVGRIIHNSQMSRLCSSLSTLLNGGLATTEAIKLSIEATDNSVFRQGLSEVYREVLTGSRLEPAILKQRVFPRLFSQTIGVGEETGALKANLTGLVNFFEQETDRAVGRATDLIEPAMIIMVGGMVGFFGVAIMSAIYSIIPQIG